MPGSHVNSIKLSQIIRYPLKSCMGESLLQAEIGDLGVAEDRRLILSEPNGQFITARTEPKLLQLKVTPNPSGWLAEHPLLGSTQIRRDSSDAAEVGVWGRIIQAPRLLDAEPWFSQLLGRTVYLLWNSKAVDRADKQYPWGPIFSDGYPLLVCTTASLEAVNYASGSLFEMSRFRPNLVIANDRPWAEDEWDRLQIGDVILRRSKACERCVLTTRDPITGDKDPQQEPLRTLAKIHRGADGEILFGQNFQVERPGLIKLSDSVKTL